MIIDALRWRWHFIMFEEDGGGGSGGESTPDSPQGGDESPDTPPEAPEDKPAEPEKPEEPKMPGYFAQLPESKAKSEAYKDLYKYQKLDELTDALIEANGKLKGMDRALIVPERGDKEGAAEFARKLGVPDEPSGYKMDALKDVGEKQPELVEAIRKGCRRMLLTTRQGEAIGEMIASVNKANEIHEKLEIRNSLAHQSERVAALYKDEFPADIDRKKAAEEDISRFESFLKETGLGEIINTSRLAGNPQMIRAISAYAKKHGGTVTAKGTGLANGTKPQSRQNMNESKDWTEFKESRGMH